MCQIILHSEDTKRNPLAIVCPPHHFCALTVTEVTGGEVKEGSICPISRSVVGHKITFVEAPINPTLSTVSSLDLLLLDRLLALAETSIVPVILVTLGVPGVVVARGQVDIGLSSGVANEVIEVKGSTRVPPVLTILSSVSPSPVVTSVAIARGVLFPHVEPQTLHGVAVQDVSKAKAVS